MKARIGYSFIKWRGLIYIKSFFLTWWQETVCEPLHKGTLIEFGHLLSFLLLDNSPVIYLWELERIPCSFLLSSTHVSLLLLVSLYPWPALWESNKEERSVLSLLLSYTLTLSNTYCLKKLYFTAGFLGKLLDAHFSKPSTKLQPTMFCYPLPLSAKLCLPV